MQKIIFLNITIFLIGARFASAQILEEYIQQAFGHQSHLKQQTYQIAKAEIAAREAKAMHLPVVNFNTTYSTAAGGRTINFPVGDLVNPIYATLNRLTPPASPKFPEGAIPNVNEQLVPKNFYDMRLKTQMPIYNTDIKYNEKIKSQMIDMARVDIDILKRELAKEVKIAYFNVLKANEAIVIYNNALRLLAETERVNKRLLANDMATPIVLIKTQNEIAKVEADKLQAENQLKNAQAYLNYLMGKNYENTIAIDTSYRTIPSLANIANTGNREELTKLNQARLLNETVLSMNQSYRKPKLGAIVDLGSQGFLKNINSENAFVLFGLSFDLPVYQGGKAKLKIQQQQQELLAITEQTKQVSQQLDLQQNIAKNNFETSLLLLPKKKNQVSTAERFYQDVQKKYREGSGNYVELFEAQTLQTNQQLQYQLSILDCWTKLAEYERAAATFPIK